MVLLEEQATRAWKRGQSRRQRVPNGTHPRKWNWRRREGFVSYSVHDPSGRRMQRLDLETPVFPYLFRRIFANQLLADLAHRLTLLPKSDSFPLISCFLT